MDRIRTGAPGHGTALLVTLCWIVLGLLGGPDARTETFHVTKTEDDNGVCTVDDCALREAVIAANATPGPDRVELDAGVYTLTINGTGDESASMTGDLDILEDLDIVGDPAGGTVIEARVDDRVIEIGFSVVNFTRVEITGGRRTGPVGTSAFGGGVRMILSDVTFVDSSITNCFCEFEGGGVAVQSAAVTFVNSTLSGNEAGTAGGAVSHDGNLPEHSLTLVNTTVSGNRAGTVGGGIFRVLDGNALISNSTIAFNEARSGDALYLDFPLRSTWIQNSIIEGQCRGLFPRSRGGNVGGPDVVDHCFRFSTLDNDLGDPS